MFEKSIGIILSKREWKRLTQKQTVNNNDSIVYQYADRGEELGIDILFFNVEQLLLHELKGNAFEIINKTVIEKGMVSIPAILYNPTKFSRKKNLRMIKELGKIQEIHVINEQNIIKSKHLYELMESKSVLKKYLDKEEQHNKQDLIIYVIGQKGIHNNWIIPFIYAKDDIGNIYSFENACQRVLGDSLEHVELLEEAQMISQKILGFLHFYYPNLYEIGLQFILKGNREIQLQATCSISTIVEDICNGDEDVFKKIVQWPIDLVNKMCTTNLENEENEFRKKIKDIEKQYESNGSSINLEQYAKVMNDSHEYPQNLWVKFKSFQDEEMKCKIPDRISMRLQTLPKIIKFGVKEELCQFIIYEDTVPLFNNSFDNPIEIFVSLALVKKMHIPLDLVFQIHMTGEIATIGPTIGLLLGEKSSNYNLGYMEKYSDRFGVYDKFGGLTIAFSPRSIDWDEMIAYGMVYDPIKNHWRYDSAPIPATIYRRNFHQNNEIVQRLVDLTENNVFNSYHFKKSDLVVLKDKPEIKNHLPTTYLLRNFEELIEFINNKQKVILKPVSLSRGRGIFIIERNNEDDWTLFDYRENSKVQYSVKNTDELYDLLISLGIQNQDYLFQTYIPLLKVNGRSFDVRVVMQKYNIKKWKCSGIECRVARENEDLTNIARGGEAMTLEDVIYQSSQNLSYSYVFKSIVKLCQRFCYLMDKSEEHFAEFGLDIALDEEGYPWILEANIYPSFKGFKEMDYQTYLMIRYQPLFYAVQIQGFTILDENEIGKDVYLKRKIYFS